MCTLTFILLDLALNFSDSSIIYLHILMPVYVVLHKVFLLPWLTHMVGRHCTVQLASSTVVSRPPCVVCALLIIAFLLDVE